MTQGRPIFFFGWTSRSFRLSLVRKGLQDLVGAQIVFGHGDKSGSHAQLPEQTTLNATLSSSTIADSYDEAIIPLGIEKMLIWTNDVFNASSVASQVKIRERYVNFDNKVRFGRILEDLDTMAGRLTDRPRSLNTWLGLI